MRVILYLRVSTAEQAGSGVSLEAQESRLRAYATAFGLDVVAVVTDAGESGKSLRRGGLQQALAMLKAGQADGLCVTALNRLTRSVVDWQSLIDTYFSERAGKQLISLAENVDTRSAMGRCLLGIIMVLSQAERETISERTSQALQYKIGRQERCGRLRYGYDLSSDGRTLVENSGEQEAIQLMKSLRADGHSLQAIANELDSRSIPTKTGAGKWIWTAVRRVLERKVA